MTVTKKKVITKKATAQKHGSTRTTSTDVFRLGSGLFRRVDFSLDLSLSGARAALASLKSALGDGKFDVAQLRLEARDLKAIYLYLRPAQAKKLVARLAVVSL